MSEKEPLQHDDVESGRPHDQDEVAQHGWYLLARPLQGDQAALLGGATRRGYRVVIEGGCWLIGGVAVVGFGILTLLPDAAMCRAYGEIVARSLSAIMVLTIVGSLLANIGALVLLKDDALRVCVDQYGQRAISHLPCHFGLSYSTQSMFEPNIRNLLEHLARAVVWMAAVLTLYGATFGSCRLTLACAATGAVYLWLCQCVTAFAKNLCTALSHAMVHELLVAISQFPKDEAHPDQDFWRRRLDEYIQLDSRLEGLWDRAKLIYAPYLGARAILGVAAGVLFLVAMRMQSLLVEVACAAAIAYCAVTLSHQLASLADITELCTGTKLMRQSLFSAAFTKSGMNKMSEQQRADHQSFIEALRLSPTGVHMVVLIDKAVMLRVAIPLFTTLSALLSQILASLGMSVGLGGVAYVDKLS
eukprot:CAMPEP_0179136302 /NCGR_PEP_ID=MMETSP0796-20121207/64944_1 /TAXON_ID=73915 /ORGANISM="Pyrodinium bahamense, Strain pbaha01" /LENGTH=416 /DNA_ID=CAMNT_0020835377 /DNA_START=17 /DNA_END=1267 /DNA_ORIENTATION=+